MSERRCGIYIHVPFCHRICPYCDFVVMRPRTGQAGRFVQRLVERIARQGEVGRLAGREVGSVYFGGGTPSLLAPAAIAAVMDAVRKAFRVAPDAEVTLEANPESVNAWRLEGWLAAGVNRLSVGVQALDGETLEFLGRPHSGEQALAALVAARRAGMRNLSADLIAGAPVQGRESWRRGVERVLASGVEHLSLYCLTIHPGTPFGRPPAAGGVRVDEERQAAHYEEGVALAEAAGLRRYEVSNLARVGFESRHNGVYWSGGDYLGLGPGAASHCAGLRWRETARLEPHLEGVGEPPLEREELSVGQRQLEAIFLGLRQVRGIDAAAFAAIGGGDLAEVVPRTLRELVEEGVLEDGTETARWRLAPRYLLLADAVAERFAGELDLGC